MKYILLSFTLIFLISCGYRTHIYYWGNYSASQYELKENPGKDSFLNHKSTLEKIFRKSKQKDKKVAPGLYCEYAQMLVIEGKKDQAKKYFNLELKTYPESRTFVENLMQQIYNKEQKND